MILKDERVKLEKKIKRLEKKIVKLKADIETSSEMEEFRVKHLVRGNQEKQELRSKIFELEQQVDAQETKGPVFQICDPSLHGMHKRRDLGVDVYVERHTPVYGHRDRTDDKKLLLTRIPINIEYDVYERMSFERRAEVLEPLVRGLRSAYNKSDEAIVHIEASVNEMYWTDDEMYSTDDE